MLKTVGKSLFEREDFSLREGINGAQWTLLGFQSSALQTPLCSS